MFLNGIFTEILNMSLAASFAIIVVILLRLLLKKVPKIISHALWGIVLLRLICPFSLESVISFLPDKIGDGSYIEEFSDDYVGDIDIRQQNSPYFEAAVSAGRTPIYDGSGFYVVTKHNELSEPDTVENTWFPVLGIIWLCGILLMSAYGFAGYLRLRRKLLTASPLEKDIYLADDIASPFVIGLFRPKIYLPSGLEDGERAYIILHEQHHIRRLDHLIKLLAYAALSVHWFNPLVWLAFILSGKDMEMSCDEAVVRRTGSGIRADYSASLLSLATGKRIIAGMPLAFGEGNTASRIRNLAYLKKPALWVVIVAVIVCIVSALCLLTDPKESPDSFTLVKQDATSVGIGSTFTYSMELGKNSKGGSIWAEQWHNGICTKSDAISFTENIEEMQIILDVRRENNNLRSMTGVDIQIDTHQYGGLLIYHYPFPEDLSVIGWGTNGCRPKEKIEIEPDSEKIFAAMIFDTGSGIRVFDPQVLLDEPERLANTEYAIIIRGNFLDEAA